MPWLSVVCGTFSEVATEQNVKYKQTLCHEELSYFRTVSLHFITNKSLFIYTDREWLWCVSSHFLKLKVIMWLQIHFPDEDHKKRNVTFREYHAVHCGNTHFTHLLYLFLMATNLNGCCILNRDWWCWQLRQYRTPVSTPHRVRASSPPDLNAQLGFESAAAGQEMEQKNAENEVEINKNRLKQWSRRKLRMRRKRSIRTIRWRKRKWRRIRWW